MPPWHAPTRYCERLAREHYENFPVASRLLPAAMRPHIAAIYAFARTADDYADEPGIAAAERLRLLDAWGARLSAAAGSGRESCTGVHDSRPDPALDPVFLALGQTIRDRRLPSDAFRGSAERVPAGRDDDDATTPGPACSTTAGGRPIPSAGWCCGSRVTTMRGSTQQSDAVCTALQLANFWQDFGRDWAIGRLYVPREDRVPAGAREEDLTAGRMTPEWRSVMRVMVRRTRELFAAGRGVCDGVGGRLRWELRLTWLGGSRILDKLERADFDVFNHRPTIGKRDIPGLDS